MNPKTLEQNLTNIRSIILPGMEASVLMSESRPQTKKKWGGQGSKTGKTCSWQNTAGPQKGSFAEAPE